MAERKTSVEKKNKSRKTADQLPYYSGLQKSAMKREIKPHAQCWVYCDCNL